MPKRALVVLGAGASYDLMSVPVGGDIRTAWRPPLTHELFVYRQEFHRILDNYPGARALAAEIQGRIQSESLERVLREFSDSNEPHIQRSFREIVPFLQDLFGEISASYVSEPVNYSRLVLRLVGSEFEQVAFLTLNYDLFLDRSLAAIGVPGPDSMSWYVQPRWMLVKLHGSVNWGRRFTNQPDALLVGGRRVAPKDVATPNREAAYLDLLHEIQIDGNLERAPVLLENHRSRWLKGDVYYPAMVVPIDGKYDYCCPPAHLKRLRDFLGDCPNLLMIGTSFRDEDLLDLFRDEKFHPSVIHLVGGSDKDAKDILPRLREFATWTAALDPSDRARNFGNYAYRFYATGFSGFLEERGLNAFVEECVD